MLVYNLPATDAIYQRFAGIDGSAYFIGGFGMTALTANNIVLVPIRSGVGLRLGANIGYLKFTPARDLESVLIRHAAALSRLRAGFTLTRLILASLCARLPWHGSVTAMPGGLEAYRHDRTDHVFGDRFSGRDACSGW